MKRDGCRVPFDGNLIKNAVLSAARTVEAMEPAYAEAVAQAVEDSLQGMTEVDIRTIQNVVENQLMSGPHKAVARAYIEYRHDRDIAREKSSRLNNEIRGLIEQSNAALLNENANKDSKVIP
ncbi:MAG: ATP cone domain-containing protein, partial [Plesiomonas sp.]